MLIYITFKFKIPQFDVILLFYKNNLFYLLHQILKYDVKDKKGTLLYFTNYHQHTINKYLHVHNL